MPNPKNQKGWFSRQSGGKQIAIVLGSLLCVGFIMILLMASIFHPVSQTDNNPHTQTSAPVQNTDVQSSSSVSGYTDAETKYRQWVKDDYKRWEKASGSSQLYNLYTGAQAVNPPEKYKEFHKHYIKSYYYYYMAALSAEKNKISDVEYYTDLALAEDDKLGEYMPDYAQLTAS